jgi:hypothetical protein
MTEFNVPMCENSKQYSEVSKDIFDMMKKFRDDNYDFTAQVDKKYKVEKQIYKLLVVKEKSMEFILEKVKSGKGNEEEMKKCFDLSIFAGKTVRQLKAYQRTRKRYAGESCFFSELMRLDTKEAKKTHEMLNDIYSEDLEEVSNLIQNNEKLIVSGSDIRGGNITEDKGEGGLMKYGETIKQQFDGRVYFMDAVKYLKSHKESKYQKILAQRIHENEYS